MKEKVLVFGVGGFVGYYLTQEFLDTGYKVYGSDIIEPATLQSEVDFIKGDLLNEETVYQIITELKPDMVVNLAAISSVGASWNIPQKTMMINVIGALNIVEAARKQENVPKVMFIGSSEEYITSNKPMNEATRLNASNPYGISKITLERFANLYRENYGMKIYYVRPFNHTGIGQKDSFVLPSFCKQVAEIEKNGKDGTIKVGNLEVQRDFSHVKDIVRAYRMIIESDDCDVIYNVGFGKAYTLTELLEYIVGLSSQKITIKVEQERFRPSDQSIICCDNRLIRDKLGWRPKYTVFDALKEMYETYLI